MTGARKTTILIGVVCLVYIALRVWRSSDACLWFDEIFSVHAAEHEWGSLFWFVAQDLIHPPLFYALLKLWISIGGESLTWLRFFPVFFSSIALFPFLHLCRELKLKRSTTLVALAFLAVNGSLIKYAQEVRMYAPLLFLSLLSLWLFARFYFRGKNIWFLTAVNILLVYTHYFGWFVVAGQVAAIFIFQRVKIRHVLIMSAIAVASFVPWLAAIAKAAAEGANVEQNIGWMARPGPRAISAFIFDLIEPFYYQQSSAEPSTIAYFSIPLLLIIVIACLMFFIERKGREENPAMLLLGIFVAVPLLLTFLISWLSPVSIWGSRHLIIVFAPAAILAAVFIDQISRPTVRYLLLAVAVAVSGAAGVRAFNTVTPVFVWCSWEKMSREWIVSPHLSSDPRRLYALEDLVAYHIWFATREMPNHDIVLLSGLEGIPNDPAYFLPRGFDGVERRTFSDVNDESFWIAFRKEVPDDDGPIGFLERSIGTPVTELEDRGYEIEDVRKIKAGRETCFLMKFRRTQLSNAP